MTPEDFEDLQKTRWVSTPKMIGPIGGGDRTLLYGYDVDRRTYHVYQKDGELHLAVYTPSNLDSTFPAEIHEHGEELNAETLVPNKRLYPEACDIQFCRRLRALDINLPFTVYVTLFDHTRRYPFVGRTF